MRYPLNTALASRPASAQIGEFSFILAALGVSLGLLPADGMSLVLAGALISIALNPLLFATIEPVRRWILQLGRRADWTQRGPDRELPLGTDKSYLTEQVVLVGYGRVGSRIATALGAAGYPTWSSTSAAS